jgi:hypothetical protein
VYKTVNEPIQQHSSLLPQQVTMNCFEPPVTHFCLRKLDILSEAKCSFSFLAAFCVHSVESDEGVSEGKKNLIFIELGKINFILLTE